VNLALLGTGLMGGAIGARLLQAGHRLTVYNRTPARAAPLVAQGARLAADPGEAAEHAEVLLLLLADASAIRALLLDEQRPVRLAGRTVIQMGTIPPAESRDLQAALAEQDADYLEAPVLGSTPEAAAGRLLVMVGGSPEQFARWQGLLAVLGAGPVRVGPVGQAAALKLALNQLIASLTAAFGLSLALVQREEVPVETFMQVLRASALYAPTFDKKLSRMLERQYSAPNFPTRHLLKDVNLFLAAAAPHGLDTRALAMLRDLLVVVCGSDLADADYSALFEGILARPG
jgi:3-hydroxyisobutyrate dehydrogenase-like beta-hydroxyacid dehydrogenase